MIGIFLHGRSSTWKTQQAGNVLSLHLVMVVLNGVSRNLLKAEWFDRKGKETRDGSGRDDGKDHLF